MPVLHVCEAEVDESQGHRGRPVPTGRVARRR